VRESCAKTFARIRLETVQRAQWATHDRSLQRCPPRAVTPNSFFQPFELISFLPVKLLILHHLSITDGLPTFASICQQMPLVPICPLGQNRGQRTFRPVAKLTKDELKKLLAKAKLTNADLKKLLNNTGRHALGRGLYFRVLGDDKAYWAFRYWIEGKEREMSLGAFPGVTIDEARKKHEDARAKVRTYKRDPIAEKRAAKQARDNAGGTPTFGEIADEHLLAHQATRKNAGHRRQWLVALTTYCAPIRDLPVDAVDTSAVLSVLKPMWTRTPDTASRLRGMIERVLDAARARDLIDGDRANPARWRGHLAHLLPNPDKIGNHSHHAAMPFADVPAFMAKLKDADGIAVNALMLTILTAARTSEVIGMQWDEVDLDAKVWNVPGERMKMGVKHDVPLSDAAVELLRRQLATRRPKQTHVFPGRSPSKPLSDPALAQTMRRNGAGAYTVHGFRSSFRDWAGENEVDSEVAEKCLAHQIGNSVTRAYFRTTMIERRRKVMADWAAFLAGESVWLAACGE
jgi:integrase